MQLKKPLKIVFKKNSLWGQIAGKTCTVTGYEFSERNKNSMSIYHDLGWEIYTSEEFEQQMTKVIQKNHPNVKKVEFSEQFLQGNGVADMDVTYVTFR